MFLRGKYRCFEINISLLLSIIRLHNELSEYFVCLAVKLPANLNLFWRQK